MSPPAAAAPPLLSSHSPTDVSTTCATYALTTAEFHGLHARSAAAKASAYCPYSRFRVGATVLTRAGAFVDGANIENAAYPVGTCAERVAFGKAVTEGHYRGAGEGGEEKQGMEGRGRGFKAVAVCTDISPPASPCGMCRQFIREFCDLDTPILMFDKDGSYVVMRLEQLLPMSFGPEALPSPGSAGAQG
ncbi:uncharacterized protein L3040_009507 [Drepanopeziza brunnea f. sp. 'multigermtubi']|uniref:Cytidine deaminase n=1 Tax=Marssonina brunnea f. sp. multigermtubi (strain MB_m1) TaxID=1072389 RepID=K1XUB9_MARBU|nr:cytidine deaminase [Drepanopeziza brunnea f. sp. 'multigermtubi' MB_m1]EKD16259.1 cytidine deaminase [Drepanopeziza brunnea f. sp. 'multigermtubi' MB_m1]KAJ5032918.1 hypothetical protein L3040_009507 [Drepanopeziza brunnea f. sp. 'multigermtubi']